MIPERPESNLTVLHGEGYRVGWEPSGETDGKQ
jgi:hypothetical protein